MDFETVPGDFPGNNRLRELAQDGELITIVAVEGREIAGRVTMALPVASVVTLPS